MNKPVLKYFYDKGVTLTTKSKTFHESIKFVLDRKEPTTFTPIKMLVEGSGLILYFDENIFKNYVEQKITQADLIAETRCDGLFRNTVEIQVSKREEPIDAGSLFKLKYNKLILIDDDRFVQFHYPDDNFVEIN